MRPASRFLLKLGAVLVIASVIISYAYYKTKDLIEGPVVTVLSPENGAELEAAVVAVSGTTKNISKITLNGHPISVNEDGVFYEEVAVPEGYSVLTVEGTDRFGKKKEVTLALVRQAGEAGAPAAPSEATSTEEAI